MAIWSTPRALRAVGDACQRKWDAALDDQPLAVGPGRSPVMRATLGPRMASSPPTAASNMAWPRSWRSDKDNENDFLTR